jgi:hypothetical protein
MKTMGYEVLRHSSIFPFLVCLWQRGAASQMRRFVACPVELHQEKFSKSKIRTYELQYIEFRPVLPSAQALNRLPRGGLCADI